MHNMKRYFCIALLFTVSACDRFDTVESEYSDSVEAINSGAIERGWIPAFLPASAREIREKHNLDTNEVWVHFLIDDGSLADIKRSCHAAQLTGVILPRKESGDWWPSALVDGSQVQAGEYAYYRCIDGGFVALRLNEQGVFYWRLSPDS